MSERDADVIGPTVLGIRALYVPQTRLLPVYKRGTSAKIWPTVAGSTNGMYRRGEQRKAIRPIRNERFWRSHTMNMLLRVTPKLHTQRN